MINVLILGGGFSGVRVALDLAKLFRDKEGIKIKLVDKNNYQTFSPALYEVASIYDINHEHPNHTELRGTVSISHAEIFKNQNVELVGAEINHIDLHNKHAVTNNGAVLEFDYLVIALGLITSTFGIRGVEEYAFKFRTIEDALVLNGKIEKLYTEASKQNRPLPISILIGGAGFNGVELAAELSNCAVHIAHRHAVIQQNCITITLIEAAPAILPMVLNEERNIIQKRLKKLGVNILTDSPIEEVGPDHVKLKNVSILKGDLIVWTAGVKALDLFKGVADLELDDRGRIFVNEFLQTKNHANVFAVGDNAVFIDPKTQKPIPQMAFLAIEQGRVAAENIIRLIHGKSGLKKFQPSYNVWIAPVGGKYAVAHIGKWNFSGFLGYLLREIVDFRYFWSVLPFFKAFKLFFEEARVFSKDD